jgi:CheY-like chemotaxis protein
MTTYHLEFDHPDWAHLRDTHYERLADAIAAHDHLAGLPDGATRVMDELGFVHAVLHVPPLESAVNCSDAVAQIAMQLLNAEDTGVLDQDSFFTSLKEVRGLLDLIEERGRAVVEHGRCCLIVEDEPALRRGIERMARTIGFTRVLTFRSVDELRRALALRDTDPRAVAFPSVVVSDYDLPGGTGVDVQALVREHAAGRCASQPILIAYSSSRENLDRMEGIRILKDSVWELDEALRLALSTARGTAAQVVASPRGY